MGSQAMGCDLVVALGKATHAGDTFFGFNGHRPPGERQALRRAPGRGIRDSTKSTTEPKKGQFRGSLGFNSIGSSMAGTPVSANATPCSG